MGGSLTYPYGSTSAVRGHVLAALGVLKVASADQIRRLTCPGHKDSKGVRNACLDLAKHGLTLSEGHTRDWQKLWGLTPLGITAAAEALGRPAADMGGNARGAARSGAPHAMAVNETVIALTGTQPVPTRPIARATPTPALATPTESAAPAVPPGLESVASWATEVVHNLPGSSRTRPSVRADAVLRAPEAGLPVLLVEVDRCTEADEVLAGKFARYREFFRVQVKDHSIAASHGGQGVPLWQSLYPPTGRDGYPPIAVVFDPGTRLGEQALKNRMNRVLDLTRDHWTGTYKWVGAYGSERSDGYYEYDDAIPLLFTTLDRIQQSGPLAGVWWRCGHRRWETLTDALDNPKDVRAWRHREKERHKAQEAREARERVEQSAASGDWSQRAPAQSEPALPPPPACDTCGEPLKGIGRDDPPAPPPDGHTCEACRRLLAAGQPTGVTEAKALACRLPAETGVPLARWSCPELATELSVRGITGPVSASTVRRWLRDDALKPWQHRSWIFITDPSFRAKTQRVLDLYARTWRGVPLGEDEYVISADEKASIKARCRCHPTLAPGQARAMRVNHTYGRGGALAYLAAYDTHAAKVFGRTEPTTGIDPFMHLVAQVIAQEPYVSAKRVFWIVDNGSSQRGKKAADRLSAAFPNAVMVHTPVHASWLNQVEIYFSVVQRKVVTPNDFTDLTQVGDRLRAFEDRYNATAQPFQWKFTTSDLDDLLARLDQHTADRHEESSAAPGA